MARRRRSGLIRPAAARAVAYGDGFTVTGRKTTPDRRLLSPLPSRRPSALVRGTFRPRRLGFRVRKYPYSRCRDAITGAFGRVPSRAASPSIGDSARPPAPWPRRTPADGPDGRLPRAGGRDRCDLLRLRTDSAAPVRAYRSGSFSATGRPPAAVRGEPRGGGRGSAPAAPAGGRETIGNGVSVPWGRLRGGGRRGPSGCVSRACARIVPNSIRVRRSAQP